MKQNSHDYSKVLETMDLLYSATRLMANECYDAALERINEARQLLQEYLSQVSMADDDGVEFAAERKTGPKIVRHGKIDRQYKQQLSGVGDPDCPLYGKVVRITGTFDQIGMTRDEVAKACQSCGAKQASEGIAKGMDIIIFGNNYGPSKMEKVRKWQEEGLLIQTLSQFDIKKIFDEYLPRMASQ